MMLYIKERFDVSGSAYHEMAKICHQMQRHYRLKQRIAELNKLWNITPTPNGVIGVQQSFKERLENRVRHLISTCSPSAPFMANKKVRIKLSGDGTNLAIPSLHARNRARLVDEYLFMNILFSLMDILCHCVKLFDCDSLLYNICIKIMIDFI